MATPPPGRAVDIDTGRLLSFKDMDNYERAEEGDWDGHDGTPNLAYRRKER